MNEESTMYTRASDLDVHETDDGLIVFNPATDKVHHLNPTAGVLWELCTGSKTAAQLITEMAELFSLDELPTEAVEEGLKQLVSENVLIASERDG
jgi:hypothetical protein